MQDPNPQIQGVGMQLADQMEANPTGGMIPATRDQIQSMAEGGAITAKKFSEGDATFRDPVMEERGYAFDPERNAYYEQQTSAKSAALDNTMFNESAKDGRYVKYDSKRKSEVTFGKK